MIVARGQNLFRHRWTREFTLVQRHFHNAPGKIHAVREKPQHGSNYTDVALDRIPCHL